MVAGRQYVSSGFDSRLEKHRRHRFAFLEDGEIRHLTAGGTYRDSLPAFSPDEEGGIVAVSLRRPERYSWFQLAAVLRSS